VVGTQLGVLSIFDRRRGWADTVDRLPGHPQSIDSLCSLTTSSSSPLLKHSADVIATGSSDGLVRLVQIHPNKLLGAVADHGDFPVERIKMDRHGKWIGSVSHDSILKMTDLEGALEDSEAEGDDSEAEGAAEKDQGVVCGDGVEDEDENEDENKDELTLQPNRREDDDEDDSDVTPEPISRKRKRKDGQKAKKKVRKGGSVDPGFFSGL